MSHRKKLTALDVLLIAVLITAAALVVLGLASHRPVRPGVTKENFLRLHRGSSLKDVEAVFGRPGKAVDCTTDYMNRWWEGRDAQHGARIGFQWRPGLYDVHATISPKNIPAADGDFFDDDGSRVTLPTSRNFIDANHDWLLPGPKKTFTTVPAP